MDSPILSICISTFNRADFIESTLESMIGQITSDCEIVVVDGASTDNTEKVISKYVQKCGSLRYFRRDTNGGVDRDFDCAVDLARGEYCWLFSDDDLFRPGAIAYILKQLENGFSMVLVNGEHRDLSMSRVRVSNYFGIEKNEVYDSTETDRLFMDVGPCLICICCVIIKRQIWISRDREKYYGTRFIHVGVALQQRLPGKTLVVASPLISLRAGNEQSHAGESFGVWVISWPRVVWSLDLAVATKRRFCSAEPWRRVQYLLALRATGAYSRAQYLRWIRPQVSSFWARLLPAMVGYMPNGIASQLYRVYSILSGAPRSPVDFWLRPTMFPQSLITDVKKEQPV